MIALHCVESALLVASKIIQSHSVLKIYKSICLDEHVVFLCLFYNDDIKKEKKIVLFFFSFKWPFWMPS